jgi:hypothetical protein
MERIFQTFIDLFNNIVNFFFTVNNGESLEEIKPEYYYDLFIKGRTKADIEKTYQKAWEAKNFEIGNYWKRANYFWAFQVAAFAGYFAVINSNINTNIPQIVYVVICIGLVTSFAWVLINKGSKSWQENWEAHVDMLEDYITGPLYKVVKTTKTFSVSKINDIVSRFITVIWIILAGKYLINEITLECTGEIAYLVIFSSLGTMYFIGSMIMGYGRGRFNEKEKDFFLRK